MNRKSKLAILAILLGAGLVLTLRFLAGADLAVLNPAGEIGQKERNLMLVTMLLAIIVVIPVFGLTGYIVWKFRETNKVAVYSPNWDHNRLLESIWWGIPTLIITILAVITWNSSHNLDPFKPIVSDKPSLTIQVVALQWKWLFIYPQQNIATVNYVQIPVDAPINFHITSDAPMNSFWVPRLGGQIYAMSGMSTQLHLMANQQGTFNGSSANISGRGFAGMNFKVQAVNQNNFDSWVSETQQKSPMLSMPEYISLAQPSENNPRALYSQPAPDLYDKVLMKYMGAGHRMGGGVFDAEGMRHEHSY